MANNKIILGGDTILDLTADTVTPDLLALGETAHGADGDSITGTALNCCPLYASAELNFTTSTNIDGWVLNLGFVPTFFLMYYVGDTVDLTGQMRVAAVMYSRLVYNSTGARSTLTRGLHVANFSSSGPRLYSYSGTGIVNPYDEGGVKGVIGQGGTGTTIYRLIGTYRYIAIG